jgi:hypothetical protein
VPVEAALDSVADEAALPAAEVALEAADPAAEVAEPAAEVADDTGESLPPHAATPSRATPMPASATRESFLENMRFLPGWALQHWSAGTAGYFAVPGLAGGAALRVLRAPPGVLITPDADAAGPAHVDPRALVPGHPDPVRPQRSGRIRVTQRSGQAAAGGGVDRVL